MYIRVKHKNETMFVETEPTQTVADVKAQIEIITEQPAEDQRIIFNDEPVEDAKTLSDANIENDAVVYVVYRLTGSDDFEEVQLE